jgi:hypothetical protein
LKEFLWGLCDFDHEKLFVGDLNSLCLLPSRFCFSMFWLLFGRFFNLQISTELPSFHLRTEIFSHLFMAVISTFLRKNNTEASKQLLIKNVDPTPGFHHLAT